MWKVRFRDDYHEEPIELYAEDVIFDGSSPFICIKGIRTKFRSQMIIVPGDDDFEEFVQFDPLYIIYSNLVFAGKFKAGELKSIKGCDNEEVTCQS